MARGSAAWVVAIVSLLALIVGAFLLTVIDPIQQTLMGSALWDSSTAYGTDALRWQSLAWKFWPVIILLGIMVVVWTRTRRPA